MTIRTEYKHGDFSWLNLGTTDVAAAKKFYSALFGWSYDDMPAGPGMTYTMCKLRDQHVAGLYALPPEQLSQGVPPNWLPYVTVASADETTGKVSENSGKVVHGPMDVLDVGRMSVFQDPTGATIAVWQPKRHFGAGVVNEPGAMCWNELATTDVAVAGRFYARTFGWTTERMDMGGGHAYTIFKAGAERVGGMMALTPQMKGVPPHWLSYFAVADCDATARTVGERDGKVLVSPQDIPNVGRFAVFQDPQHAAFAVIKPASS